ncbi:hypothetical protein [Mucilaginibacter sp. dw_454]|uniref:hypothetical protein n=1 Tax=Mucilaginibacter sp. dw_454 TaxID=2720079 RepID=UPI001BD1DC74|nr:hypothetical protein [Mucilaginibacter sp. dw_454]
METTVYTYSRKNSIVTIVMMLILGGLFISNVYRAYYTNDRFNLVLFAALVMVLAALLVLLVFKRLIPAFKNEPILELNQTELIDYLKNITIGWQDIESIRVRRTRSTSLLVIRLKWESDHGRDIVISLRWVAGGDGEICSKVMAYFDQFGPGAENNGE